MVGVVMLDIVWNVKIDMQQSQVSEANDIDDMNKLFDDILA